MAFPASSSPLRRLAPLFAVQFACWSGMFLMWIASYPLIALAILDHGGQAAPARAALVAMACAFAGYATLAALLAFAIPALLARVSPPVLLGAAALAGAAGLALLAGAAQPLTLAPAYALVAVGWAALSNLPYTIAVRLLDEGEIDHGLRQFAFSTVVPQLAVTALIVWGVAGFDANAARALLRLAAAAMAAGGLLALALRRALWPLG